MVDSGEWRAEWGLGSGPERIHARAVHLVRLVFHRWEVVRLVEGLVLVV